MKLDWTMILAPFFARFALGLGVGTAVGILGAIVGILLAIGPVDHVTLRLPGPADIFISPKKTQQAEPQPHAAEPLRKAKQEPELRQPSHQLSEVSRLYDVVNLRPGQVLPIRREPTPYAPMLRYLAHDSKRVLATGNQAYYNSDIWIEVRAGGETGWVSGYYLETRRPRAAILAGHS